MRWWESRFLSVKNGRLQAAGHDVTQLASKHGTPLFVYGKKRIQSRFRSLMRAFHEKTDLEPRICYAMKANSHPDILELLYSEGAWIDAVSPGEVASARNAGFPGTRILFSGTSLGPEDFRRVLCHNDVIITIDAEEQLDLLQEARKTWYPHKKVRISVRWNPGIGRGFNPKVITAGARSSDDTPIKFGIEENRVRPFFERARRMGMNPVGLHQHLGSGWVKEDLEEVKLASDRLVEKAVEIQQAGHSLEYLDFGGGFSPRYLEEQEVFPVEEYIAYIGESLTRSPLKLRAVALEPGKYLVGDAGVLLLKVEYVKKSYGNLFACVNAGTFNTVPRPAIYASAQHAIINGNRVNDRDRRPITVAGNLCETGDVFAKEILLPVPRRGDILALLCAGAYCRSMASRYNSREIPEEIIL